MLSLRKQLIFILAFVGILAGVLLVLKQKRDAKRPSQQAVTEPARTPFPSTIGASGLVEAVRENVRIAAPQSGLITDVHVRVGDEVATGVPLLQIDNRQAQADVRAQQAQIPVLQARLREAEAAQADRRDQYRRIGPLSKNQVLSETEGERARFALLQAEAQVQRARSELEAAVANLEKSKTNLNILTVRAPREGTVLQVNVRTGEYASQQVEEPLILLGETKSLQVRADIDEQNASRFRRGAPAVAFVKGVGEQAIPLRFVRVEPYIVPKRSLTGLSTERVDTRVLQVIYGFTPPDNLPVFVGQQMDVFIDATPPSQEKAAARTTAIASVANPAPAVAGSQNRGAGSRIVPSASAATPSTTAVTSPSGGFLNGFQVLARATPTSAPSPSAAQPTDQTTLTVPAVISLDPLTTGTDAPTTSPLPTPSPVNRTFPITTAAPDVITSEAAQRPPEK